MNKRLVKCLLAIAIMVFAQAPAWAVNNNSTLVQEDVILQWNRVLMETVLTPGQHPATIMPVRSYAMMHAAMFDAVNSIDETYTAYMTDVPGSPHASIQAAAAQAARDVLAALYPTRVAVFNAELAISLRGIERNRAQQGIRVGEIVAERMLAARANDGWNVPPPVYTLPATPGNWQPTPPGNAAATFTHYPSVLPFGIKSGTQFAPNAPPSMTSAQYAADFNEVKELGSVNSATRTADQTQVARLWANINTPTNFLLVWNNVARTVSVARGISTVKKARLFALTNISLHDALQTTFASKFQHGLWRPVTAIRRADEDGNAATTPDTEWSSLVPSPPYPSYAGNMAAIGTSQATILALFFGRDDIRFEHTWAGAGGATRSYAGFGAMADEQARARVYGGIHFTFDNVAGQSVGTNVANYVFSKLMRPRKCVR
ncbi:MAG TPA: vanadium-dependent haloperoxidase [Pyrinomonadaceae bacterium]|nr:vanadium-dependent haloperoxidase [Pyrinomonadaceae bacterium]